jgi:hypothetical protein
MKWSNLMSHRMILLSLFALKALSAQDPAEARNIESATQGSWNSSWTLKLSLKDERMEDGVLQGALVRISEKEFSLSLGGKIGAYELEISDSAGRKVFTTKSSSTRPGRRIIRSSTPIHFQSGIPLFISCLEKDTNLSYKIEISTDQPVVLFRLPLGGR